MKAFRTVRVLGFVLLLVGGVIALSNTTAAQKDPSVGTWQLNLAKSTYSPGPAPKSNVVTIEASGDGTKVVAKGVDASGNPTGTQYTASYDGKDHKVTVIGPQDYDTLTLKKIDSNRIEGTRKRAGKVVQTYSRVVSSDGKTMTITTKGTNAKGEQVNNVAVYEKK